MSLISIHGPSPSPRTTMSTCGWRSDSKSSSSDTTLTCGPPNTMGMSNSCLIAAAVRQACFTWGVLVVMPTRCGRNSCRNSASGWSSTSAS